MEGWTVGRLEGWTDGRINEQREGLMEGWKGRNLLKVYVVGGFVFYQSMCSSILSSISKHRQNLPLFSDQINAKILLNIKYWESGSATHKAGTAACGLMSTKQMISNIASTWSPPTPHSPLPILLPPSGKHLGNSEVPRLHRRRGESSL